jgi:UDP-MurNAc hydroxylase
MTSEGTRLKVLGHACLVVQTASTKIIMDPWLVGSCYWRSWWNFPMVQIEDCDLSDIDAIFISHIHWDHWHGPTLKRYFKGVPLYIADDPNPRSLRDLRSIGFEDVTVVSHGKSVCVGDIEIWFFNFGLYLNDTCLVVRTPDVKVLNANDAKISGPPLSSIVRRFGKFDFALRSHSSANPRVCYRVINGSQQPDDREHYLRSFKLFMDAVKPVYAIPFASNHCHLNFDVRHFNGYITNPYELEEYVSRFESDWRLQVMLPGCSWSLSDGFVGGDSSAFEKRDEYLAAYELKVHDRLVHYRDREDRVVIGEPLGDAMRKFLKNSGASSGDLTIILRLTRPSGKDSALVVTGTDVLLREDFDVPPRKGIAVIAMPAVILLDSIKKNMFHHASISKRVSYVAWDDEDMAQLKKFVSAIEKAELTDFSSKKFYRRLVVSYVRRWRELLVYAVVFVFMKFRGYEPYKIEEVILEKFTARR